MQISYLYRSLVQFVCAAGLTLSSAQAETVVASLTTLPSGHVVTQAMVNDRGPYRFIVDTAAATTAILPSVRTALDLKPIGSSVLRGASGEQEIERFRLDRVTVAGVETKALNVAGLPDGPVAKLGIDGILGTDVLATHVVAFDQAARQWELRGPAGNPASGASWIEVPLTLTPMKLALLTVELDGKCVTAVLDTGAPSTIINWATARQLGIGAGDSSLSAAKAIGGATLQKTQRAQRAFGHLKLGELQLAHPTLSIADLPVFKALGLADQPAMILGIDQIKNRRFIVDYPRRRLLLAPTASQPLAASVTSDHTTRTTP